MSSISLNGIDYSLPPDPVVVVCIDGGDPAYFERGVADGILPTVSRFMRDGFAAVADGTVPSFTCPNNMSIVTGAPASVHGISGNFYLDRSSGEAVPMTGPELLRSATVLAEFSRIGVPVLAVTAKDKLRRQLSKGMDFARGSISFSSEKADRCTLADNGIDDVLEKVGMPLPDMYSPELSLFVLEAGIRLIEARRPRIAYLSLSDWIQHKYAPGEAESDAFHAALDDCFRRLDALGAVVALTADHGMNDKSLPDGAPKVVWLQDVLDRELGAGRTRVICPITDAFVAHHGALGGFVRVWCLPGASPEAVIDVARRQPGIAIVMNGADACAEFDLPPDREGDVVVIGDRHTCIGAARADHDLSGLAGHRLRTHGALTEARVPFVLNRPLRPDYRERAAHARLKSHHIFDFALNGTLDRTPA